MHRTFVCYSKCCKDFIENLLLEEENERLETVNENDSLSKSIDELFKRIDEWTASSEVMLFVERNQEQALVQSELTTSRLKERERLTTSFTYPNMQAYGDLHSVVKDKDIQAKLPSSRSSARAVQSMSSREKNYRLEKIIHTVMTLQALENGSCLKVSYILRE